MTLVRKAEESWECSLLPPRRSLPPRARTALTRVRASAVDSATSAAAALVATPVKAAAMTDVTLGTPCQQGSRARLLSLQMTNFKCFDERTISFEWHECSCIVGPNSSGKSSILEAIRFVTLRPVKNIRGLVRRCRPAILRCCVIAVFETERMGRVTLRRGVILDSPKEHRVTCAVADCESALTELSEASYAAWMEKAICWTDTDVIVNQFGLLEEHSVTDLLSKLPKALDQVEADAEIAPPMLKRRPVSSQSLSSVSSVTGIRTKAEAWVARRLDEIYCELTRQPLDEHYQSWGDGGQACLRRLPDGSFTIFVSHRRGVAALGNGSPLECLSDGDRDICAIALLLTLPGLLSGRSQLKDALPPLVILDEPDSRLDKRGALCLRRLLSGPGRPAQCMLMSLNNHHAFQDGVDTILLPEVPAQPRFDGHALGDEDDPYGDTRARARTGLAAGVQHK